MQISATNTKTLLLILLLGLATHAPAADLEEARPEDVGMSSERLARLDAKMLSYVNDGKVPGVVTMIARRGKLVHQGAWGSIDVNTGRKARVDSLFRIYSMTKPITSVAVMMLYEEGHFHLRDPISQYLPEFRNTRVLVDGQEVAQKNELTIHHLLSHTSGMTYGYFGDTQVDRMYREANLLESEDLAEFTRLLAGLPLLHQPGERWHYSVSTDVLGRLVEVVSGMPFDQFLRQRLFRPLAMNDTFFSVPDNKLDRFGTNHARSPEGELTVVDAPKTSQFRDVTLFSGGGGLVSTAPDYLRFAQMLLNGGELEDVRILSRKSVDLMRINHLSPDMAAGFGEDPGRRAGFGFGLGFGMVLDLASSQIIGSEASYWWGGAAGTIFWIDPEEELIAVAMIQHMRFPYPLRNDVQVLTYQSLID